LQERRVECIHRLTWLTAERQETECVNLRQVTIHSADNIRCIEVRTGKHNKGTSIAVIGYLTRSLSFQLASNYRDAETNTREDRNTKRFIYQVQVKLCSSDKRKKINAKISPAGESQIHY
jgi:hypothetical protein